MPVRPPRELSDDEPLSAQWLNQFVAFVDANSVLSLDSTLSGSSGPSGVTLGGQETPDTWIKLTYVSTAAVGSYSWIEWVPAGGGGWTAGFRQGFATADPARHGMPADPAWESNGNGTLAVAYVVRASRDPAVGRLSFRGGHC
jgi:hypothetical protein